MTVHVDDFIDGNGEGVIPIQAVEEREQEGVIKRHSLEIKCKFMANIR